LDVDPEALTAKCRGEPVRRESHVMGEFGAATRDEVQRLQLPLKLPSIANGSIRRRSFPLRNYGHALPRRERIDALATLLDTAFLIPGTDVPASEMPSRA
jgi:hypothetical protein